MALIAFILYDLTETLTRRWLNGFDFDFDLSFRLTLKHRLRILLWHCLRLWNFKISTLTSSIFRYWIVAELAWHQTVETDDNEVEKKSTVNIKTFNKSLSVGQSDRSDSSRIEYDWLQQLPQTPTYATATDGDDDYVCSPIIYPLSWKFRHWVRVPWSKFDFWL